MPDDVLLALEAMAEALDRNRGEEYCAAWDALQAALGGTDPASARAALARRADLDLGQKTALLNLADLAPAGWAKVLMPGVKPCAATRASLRDRLALLLAE